MEANFIDDADEKACCKNECKCNTEYDDWWLMIDGWWMMDDDDDGKGEGYDVSIKEKKSELIIPVQWLMTLKTFHRTLHLIKKYLLNCREQNIFKNYINYHSYISERFSAAHSAMI